MNENHKVRGLFPRQVHLRVFSPRASPMRMARAMPDSTPQVGRAPVPKRRPCCVLSRLKYNSYYGPKAAREVTGIVFFSVSGPNQRKMFESSIREAMQLATFMIFRFPAAVKWRSLASVSRRLTRAGLGERSTAGAEPPGPILASVVRGQRGRGFPIVVHRNLLRPPLAVSSPDNVIPGMWRTRLHHMRVG